jgi:hypothetical protein
MAGKEDYPVAGAGNVDAIMRPLNDMTVTDLQIRVLLSRYCLSVPVAAVVAELAFPKGGAA